MYKNFYGLKDKPFNLTPDPEYLYLGDQHKKALEFLHESARGECSLIALSGDVGSGKTILLRGFLKEPGKGVSTIQVLYPTSSRIQLLQMLLTNLGVKTQHENLSLLRDELTNQLRVLFQKHRRILLIIDEAQNLKGDAMDEVFRIIEPKEKAKSPKALLSGLPEMFQNLSGLKTRPLLRSTSFDIGNLPDEEVAGYINSRLAKAGRSDATLFPEETIDEIRRAATGIPRVINILCETALMRGYLAGSKTITVPIIKETIESLNEIISPQSIIGEAGEDSGGECALETKTSETTPGKDMTSEERSRGKPSVPESLYLKIYVLEKNARMRVHFKDHFQKIGYNAVVTDSVESLANALDTRSAWELQIIVMDAAFFLSEHGEGNRTQWSVLDRIQTTYSFAPLIVTAVLSLSSMRETLLHRGVSYLVKKPDLSSVDLSILRESVDAFMNELQNVLANIQSQYNSFFDGVIRWSIKKQERDENL